MLGNLICTLNTPLVLSATAPLAGGTAKLGARFLLGELDGTMKDAAKRANLDTKYRAWNIDAGYTYPAQQAHLCLRFCWIQ